MPCPWPPALKTRPHQVHYCVKLLSQKHTMALEVDMAFTSPIIPALNLYKSFINIKGGPSMA